MSLKSTNRGFALLEHLLSSKMLHTRDDVIKNPLVSEWIDTTSTSPWSYRSQFHDSIVIPDILKCRDPAERCLTTLGHIRHNPRTLPSFQTEFHIPGMVLGAISLLSPSCTLALSENPCFRYFLIRKFARHAIVIEFIEL